MNLEAVSHVIDANANFSKKLYDILSRKEGNIVCSPISVHTILSVLYQGAVGQTANNLQKALDLPDTKITAEGYRRLMENLNSLHSVRINFANKIFISKQFALKTEFNSVAKECFLSEAQNVNFSESVAVADKINSWVEGKTNNKIKDLVSASDFDGDTTLFLVNAIYFKGDWLEEFSITEKKKFYLSETENVDCDMMWMKEELRYRCDKVLNAQIVCLPYRNKSVSLIIILPESKTGIEDLRRKFQTTDLTQLNKSLYTADVSLSLPKFKIETTIDLNDPLSELGLDSMFCNAELPHMLKSSQPIKISKVVQKAFIEVNETGTEAAAATGCHIMLCCGVVKQPLEKVEFNADHPFLFCLCYHYNGVVTPLFTGTLKNPTKT